MWQLLNNGKEPANYLTSVKKTDLKYFFQKESPSLEKFREKKRKCFFKCLQPESYRFLLCRDTVIVMH